MNGNCKQLPMEYIKGIQAKNEDLGGQDYFMKIILLTFNLTFLVLHVKSSRLHDTPSQISIKLCTNTERGNARMFLKLILKSQVIFIISTVFILLLERLKGH
jgi:hypothetical protein